MVLDTALRSPEAGAERWFKPFAASLPKRINRGTESRKSRLSFGLNLGNGGNDLAHRAQAATCRHPLDELDHVQPTFLRLDLRHEGLRLVQPFGQLSLGQPRIKAHLPELLAQVNVFRCAKGFGQLTAC